MKMEELPAPCPRCGRLTSWSPTRVWCISCSFQMADRKYESEASLLRRWNAAVRDGEGYVELVRENNDREAKKRLDTRREASMANDVTNEPELDFKALFADA